MEERAKNLLRELPSIDRLLKHPKSEPLLTRFNRDYVTEKCREVLDELRQSIRLGKRRLHRRSGYLLAGHSPGGG